MATPLKPNLVGFNAITCTVASLATSSTLTAGRSSAIVDLSANPLIDLFIMGTIKTGAAITAGTIQVWVYAVLDGANTLPDTLTTADANVTLTDVNTRNAGLKQIANITATVSNQAYSFGPVSFPKATSVAVGPMSIIPVKFGIFVTHNTVAALNASGHSLLWNGEYFNIG